MTNNIKISRASLLIKFLIQRSLKLEKAMLLRMVLPLDLGTPVDIAQNENSTLEKPVHTKSNLPRMIHHYIGSAQ